jgi:hypothetical protein
MHIKMWVATALLLLSFGARSSGAQESLRTYPGAITPDDPKAFESLLNLERTTDGAFILRAGLFEVDVQGIRLNAKGGLCQDSVPPHPAKNTRARSVTRFPSSAEPGSWTETPDGLYVRCLPAARAKIRLQLIVPNAAVPASRQLSGFYQPSLYMVYTLGSEDGPKPPITRDVTFDPRQFLAAQTNDSSLRLEMTGPAK